MPIFHPFEPIYDKNSRVLILGSFPSVKSREINFYYGHKQNRFWKVMAAVLGCKTVPETAEDKTEMLLNGRIALWDTIASCDIIGSSDISISNVTLNDLTVILENADIHTICCNGAKSYELFMKYTAPKIREWEKQYTPIEFIKLPSTSPANAAWSLERLVSEWKRLIF